MCIVSRTMHKKPDFIKQLRCVAGVWSMLCPRVIFQSVPAQQGTCGAAVGKEMQLGQAQVEAVLAATSSAVRTSVPAGTTSLAPTGSYLPSMKPCIWQAAESGTVQEISTPIHKQPCYLAEAC